MKTPYVKTVKDAVPETTDSFMRDARANGSSLGSTAAPKKTHAPYTIREVKRLNWF